MPIFLYFAVAAISAVVSYLLMPKPTIASPAAAESVDVPTANEGAPIPVLFGTRMIKGANVVWYGDVKAKAIKKKGGKK